VNVSVATTTRDRRRLRPGVEADHHHYRWWALSCTSLGMLLATLNSGTLIIALPDLERSLHTSLLTLVWVILAYMIASTVLVVTAGRLSDLFGRKKAYVGGFLLFAATSLGAGFAGDGTELILWRIVQGVGGAFLFANASAIVTDAFPREQLGVAMGTNTMVAAVGLVLGPVLGGALVEISWHWVFWFNVPFALLGSLWAAAILRDLARPDAVRGLDIPGGAVFVVGVGSGMFNSPNTAAMMGTVPTYRRGIAAGTRTVLQNTGAVISIAFVLAIVTASVDKDTLFKIFSGVTTGLSDATLEPFVSNMHTALWVLAATSVVGGVICLLRPKGD
jgi:MFS family permease